MTVERKRDELGKFSSHHTVDEICEALKKTNGMIMLAAKTLNMTRDAIYKRARKSKKIQETIKMAREELIDLAESKLRLAILDGQPWAIALALKTVGKYRGYVERIEHEHDGADTKVVQIYLPDNKRDVIDAEFKEPKQLEEGEDADKVTTEAREVQQQSG